MEGGWDSAFSLTARGLPAARDTWKASYEAEMAIRKVSRAENGGMKLGSYGRVAVGGFLISVLDIWRLVVLAYSEGKTCIPRSTLFC